MDSRPICTKLICSILKTLTFRPLLCEAIDAITEYMLFQNLSKAGGDARTQSQRRGRGGVVAYHHRYSLNERFREIAHQRLVSNVAMKTVTTDYKPRFTVENLRRDGDVANRDLLLHRVHGRGGIIKGRGFTTTPKPRVSFANHGDSRGNTTLRNMVVTKSIANLNGAVATSDGVMRGRGRGTSFRGGRGFFRSGRGGGRGASRVSRGSEVSKEKLDDELDNYMQDSSGDLGTYTDDVGTQYWNGPEDIEMEDKK